MRRREEDAEQARQKRAEKEDGRTKILYQEQAQRDAERGYNEQGSANAAAMEEPWRRGPTQLQQAAAAQSGGGGGRGSDDNSWNTMRGEVKSSSSTQPASEKLGMWGRGAPAMTSTAAAASVASVSVVTASSLPPGPAKYRPPTSGSSAAAPPPAAAAQAASRWGALKQ